MKASKSLANNCGRKFGKLEKFGKLVKIVPVGCKSQIFSPCGTVFHPNPPAHNCSSDEREHKRSAIGVDMRFHQGPILSPCQKSGEVRCDVLVGEMAENARLVPLTPSESARMSEKAALVPPSSRWQRSRAAEDILDVGRD